MLQDLASDLIKLYHASFSASCLRRSGACLQCHTLVCLGLFLRSSAVTSLKKKTTNIK